MIYLQTTIARQKRSYDKGRFERQDENFNAHVGFKSKTGRATPEGLRPVSGKLQSPHGDKAVGDPQQGNFISPKVNRKPANPIPVPPRTSSMPKGTPILTVVSQVDGNGVGKCKPATIDHREESDHEYEDLEMNEKFVKSNLLGPKPAVKKYSLRDALRPFRQGRDGDSSDDGRLSPSSSLMLVPRRLSSSSPRGSGSSTPDRRSDGYLSSEHDDSSSAGICQPLQRGPKTDSSTVSSCIHVHNILCRCAGPPP